MRRLVCFALPLFLAAATPAGAGKPAGKGKKEKHKAAALTLRFSVHEREKVRLYFAKKHGRGNCPPGLAKKQNGCLPPGLAKKRYAVGQPVPAGLEIEEPAAELSISVGPPPAGYRYAVIDGDLVKLAVGTLLVVDAIEGLVE